MWNGSSGWPVAPASQTAPGWATRAGPARAIERERRRLPRRQLAPQLHQRPHAAARRRPARGAVAEPLDDARNPLAVEILAGDDDDAAVAPVEGRRQDPPVPEREDRLAARRDDRVVMGESVDAPAKVRPSAR